MTHKPLPKKRSSLIVPVVVVALMLSAAMLAWRFVGSNQPGQVDAAASMQAAPSLIERLLNQPAVVASTVAAGVLLVAGLGLSILPRLRIPRGTAPRAETRTPVRPTEEQDTLPAERKNPPDRTTQQASPPPASSAANQPTPVQSGDAADGQIKEQPVVSVTPAQPTEPQAPAAIQEILASVFESDEGMGHYDMLLSDMQDISARDLAAACESIARQLRARRDGESL